MTRLRSLAVALAIPFLAAACVDAAPPLAQSTVAPVCGGKIVFDGRYCRLAVEDWTVFFDMRLLREQPKTTDDALRLLHVKLREIATLLPPQRVAELRRVPIWMEMKTAENSRFMYHPGGSRWPREHGFPDAKIGSVNITDTERFVRGDGAQPSALLHELAHAYHNQVLGHRNEAVIRAYKHASESGLYRDVKQNGGRIGPAYALTNEREYFAELTEAYFGRNDFFPFVRDELRAYDPTGFEAVRAAWEDYPAQIERRVVAPGPITPGAADACPTETMLRSRESRDATRLVVRNSTAQPVKMIWLDFQGARKPYADVPAGALYVQETYLNHPWLVTDMAGRCLAVLIPDRDGSSIWFGE